MLHFLLAGQSLPHLALVLIAAFVAGLSRGFSGFGAALIFVPLASSVLGPKLAAPLLMIIDAVMASGLLPAAWPRADKRNVALMALGGLFGIPLGTLVLALVDPVLVRWFIAGVVVLLLALLISGWRYHGVPSRPLTVLVGLISGIFSGSAGAGGPPVIAYWLGSPAPVALIRANIILYFAVATVLTFFSYLIAGLFSWHLLPLCCSAGLLYGAGILLGSRLFGRVSDRIFRRLAYGLIAASALLSLPIFDALLR
ncbi:sulfite exporter TauE/SafE family protein [Thioclava sp. BHET1]|nr:sulfite exporter TauE/SafE family protein [Thioclava sp. BHET1]